MSVLERLSPGSEELYITMMKKIKSSKIYIFKENTPRTIYFFRNKSIAIKFYYNALIKELFASRCVPIHHLGLGRFIVAAFLKGSHFKRLPPHPTQGVET